ncbi:hypothetical protein H4S08_004537 [Coemansia sp. RSA 1365]|nr:hypothetical protein H4S08_004537 [Coemansia sp. RSA 1365]
MVRSAIPFADRLYGVVVRWSVPVALVSNSKNLLTNSMLFVRLQDSGETKHAPNRYQCQSDGHCSLVAKCRKESELREDVHYDQHVGVARLCNLEWARKVYRYVIHWPRSCYWNHQREVWSLGGLQLAGVA